MQLPGTESRQSARHFKRRRKAGNRPGALAAASQARIPGLYCTQPIDRCKPFAQTMFIWPSEVRLPYGVATERRIRRLSHSAECFLRRMGGLALCCVSPAALPRCGHIASGSLRLPRVQASAFAGRHVPHLPAVSQRSAGDTVAGLLQRMRRSRGHAHVGGWPNVRTMLCALHSATAALPAGRLLRQL